MKSFRSFLKMGLAVFAIAIAATPAMTQSGNQSDIGGPLAPPDPPPIAPPPDIQPEPIPNPTPTPDTQPVTPTPTPTPDTQPVTPTPTPTPDTQPVTPTPTPTPDTQPVISNPTPTPDTQPNLQDSENPTGSAIDELPPNPGVPISNPQTPRDGQTGDRQQTQDPTAVGDLEAELGFAGLAVLSGVKTALASLWYVSDVGTLGFMSELYYQLSETLIKSQAVRRSQLAMLRGEVRVENGTLRLSNGETVPLPPELAKQGNFDLSHPYFWSAFTNIGNWN